MDIPQGYKQTELGIIPEDWEVKQIRDGLTILTDFDAMVVSLIWPQMYKRILVADMLGMFEQLI